jgi:membrane fusion protein (multidrug efflux system)
VYILGDSAKVINTPIETMKIGVVKFYVVTNGLKPGDKVVLESFQSLRDGTNIKPEEKNTDSLAISKIQSLILENMPIDDM